MNTFDVFNLKPGAEYNFRITPRNRYGWGESYATSKPLGIDKKVVNLPEFIKILPGQLKGLLGQEIILCCQVQSDVIPTITWYKDSQQIDFENESRLRQSYDKGECHLIINNLQEDDSGRYTCEAVNKRGRVSTFVRLLAVSDPKILEADTQLKK